ncbi:MAG: hypothetical protein AAGJ94_03665 [Pseudomonadota bacterium]
MRAARLIRPWYSVALATGLASHRATRRAVTRAPTRAFRAASAARGHGATFVALAVGAAVAALAVGAAVAALGLGTASTALAQEKPRWFAVGDASNLARWGIPDTDAVGFEVICLNSGEVEMRPALFAMSEPTATPDIRFLVDGEPYVRDAKLGFSERDAAWQASAVVARDDALINALRRGSSLTYDFDPPLREGDSFTISLSGSAKAIDSALEDC